MNATVLLSRSPSPSALLTMPDTLADRLNALCEPRSATWDRTPQPDGTIVVRVHFSTGDVLAGRGATTADAVLDVERKVAASFPLTGA
jgi:hypothetical protein